jgi:hypothetical protein
MPCQTQKTIKAQLLDQLVDGGLDAYVSRARAAGDSWQRLAMDLSQTTGVYVTYESLRSWYLTSDADRASA